MPTVMMPDNTPVFFPDDMPKEQIAGMIASKFPDAVPKQSPSAESGLIGKVEQGLSMATGDELQAALASGIGGTAQRVAAGLGMDIKPQPYGDIYNNELSQVRGALKNAEKEYPTGSVIAEVAGGVAPALTGYGAAGKLGLTTAKTAMGRRAKESVLGAIGSGAYGFASGEGDAEKRGKSALQNAAVGAVLSPALGYGAEKLSKPVGAVYNKASELFSGNPRTAGQSSNFMADELKRAIDSGDEQTKNTLLRQINGGKVALPFEVPLSQGNITKDLQTQGIEELARKGAKGDEALRIMQEFDTRQNQALGSNISSLIKPGDAPANMIGDDIVNNVASKYGAAKSAKTAAYKEAKPLMEKAWLFKNSLTKFGNELEETIKREFSPEMGRKVRQALNNNIAEAGEKATNIPFSRVHDFNKQMGNLGAFGTPESAAGGRAKALLREFLDGDVITGDKTAVSAIRMADKLNVALKRTYQDSRASPIVKEIVNSVDNNVAIAPEKIFQSISTGNSKQNAHNVKSLIDILGADHPTIHGLRDSVLKDIRDSATDANGFISPTKLAGNIDKFITTNRSVSNQLISQEEAKMLKTLQKTARDIAYRAPGVVNNSNSSNILMRGLDGIARSFVGRKVPFLPSAVNSIADASSAKQVRGLVAPVIEAKPIFGGAGEFGIDATKRISQ